MATTTDVTPMFTITVCGDNSCGRLLLLDCAFRPQLGIGMQRTDALHGRCFCMANCWSHQLRMTAALDVPSAGALRRQRRQHSTIEFDADVHYLTAVVTGGDRRLSHDGGLLHTANSFAGAHTAAFLAVV